MHAFNVRKKGTFHCFGTKADDVGSGSVYISAPELSEVQIAVILSSFRIAFEPLRIQDSDG